MKIIILAFIIFLFPSKNNNSKAGILDFFSSDPFFYGCVYDPFGKKIGCAEYKYNEQKNRGSSRIAENLCNAELKKYKEILNLKIH